jgi:hypothetical protein
MNMIMIDPIAEGACSRIDVAGQIASLYTRKMTMDFCEEMMDSSAANLQLNIALGVLIMLGLQSFGCGL